MKTHARIRITGAAILLSLVLIEAPAEETAAPSSSEFDAALAAELETLGQADQSDRKELSALTGDSEEVRERWARQEATDRRNMERLAQIVSEHGWPSIGRVGPAGATAAFLILQHAELEPQKRFLPLLREARDAGEARADLVAMLEDRVRMREGQPQIYGTQVVMNEETGQPELYRIEDESQVERLRATVGLGPLADYLAALGVVYEPPADDPSADDPK